MAQSFSQPPDVKKITLGGSNVATQLNFPNNARRVRMYFETNAGKVATTGTDGGAIDAAHMLVANDTDYDVWVDRDTQDGGRGPASLYIASATGSTVVRVLCMSG